MNKERQGDCLNEEVTMSVSSLVRKDGEKALYVMFAGKGSSAEFVLPEGKLLNSKGFTEDEIAKLQEYIQGEKDQIFAMAKDVNPMKAFLGK